ncbi:hypothetical protein TNIN_444151 [Trichonephila inaurata madagascariensis]|uniref:Uncharacterized protein n=1 Tax=Trichonephila inaurata madagascariensis TaxID=2747483 RepID=A0A8X6XSE1_9ARAC|nr:hypothetical protein TNIN_444151 [Trichonephila inaurata madagascariensis]
MVKGVASMSKMSSDSDSDMEMNSENSGHTFNSRSSRSKTSTSMTPITDCQRFKMTINKLHVAEDAILHYEEQVQNSLPEKKKDGFKSLLKLKRQEGEAVVRELNILPPCTNLDCSDHYSALADSSNSKKNSHSEKIKSNVKKSKAQKRKDCKDNQDDLVFPKKTIRPSTPIKTPEPVVTQNDFENLEQDGVASMSKMSSDSDSDMEMNSEISGHTFKSRSSRSGTSTSMTPVTDYQRLKMTMNKLQVAEDAVLHYEDQVQNSLPGKKKDGFKTLLKLNRQEREAVVRELNILPPCTDLDCPDHYSALADSSNSKKNSQSEKIKSNVKKSKAQKRKECKDNQDDFVIQT